MEETKMNENQLDEIVHSGTDALVLGCLDKVGQITYREALEIYAVRERQARATAQVINEILKF
jgi:hypothetical protein